ncbi:MAG TPA: DUF4383 domain-containing protein, partial [Candidatus Acidoferrum sp.]|nr:DUF4383 domain-containing protein [Candidatus Acidoferrum sp.]
MKRHHVRKGLLVLFGALFIAFGIAAFFGVPGGHDASHHTVGHNLTHIIAGIAVLAVAIAGTSGTRRWFCFAFGAMYLAIGLFGVFGVSDSLRIIPGVLEFHLEDDRIQLATGLLFVALGLLKKVPRTTPGMRANHGRLKAQRWWLIRVFFFRLRQDEREKQRDHEHGGPNDSSGQRVVIGSGPHGEKRRDDVRAEERRGSADHASAHVG